MSDCMDGIWEIEQIDKMLEQFPSVEEMRVMRISLGLKNDTSKMLTPDDAWSYYHELKSMVDQQQRKTA